MSDADNTVKKLQPYYRLGSEYDLQRCYGFQLNGTNETQYFVKGDGAWTAMHYEDCGLASFNINVGPDTSHWTLMHLNQMDALSAVVREKLKLKGKLDLRLVRHDTSSTRASCERTASCSHQ